MKKFILIILCVLFSGLPAFAGQGNLDDGSEFKPQILKLQIEKVDDEKKDSEGIEKEEIKPEIEHKSFKMKAWHFVKGEAMDDSLILGMWSHHFSSKFIA